VATYTQANGSWVGVTRAAPTVRVFTRLDGSHERRFRAHFTVDGQAAAMGFYVDADALRFDYSPLDAPLLRAQPAWPMLYRRLAGQFFYHQLNTDPEMESLQLNDLEIEWLWQVSLTMVVQTAIEHQQTLAEAAAIVAKDFLASARTTLAVIFGSTAMDAGRSAAVLDEVVNEEHLVEPVAREADVPDETERDRLSPCQALAVLRCPGDSAASNASLAGVMDRRSAATGYMAVFGLRIFPWICLVHNGARHGARSAGRRSAPRSRRSSGDDLDFRGGGRRRWLNREVGRPHCTASAPI
jgi:hypothetical protein